VGVLNACITSGIESKAACDGGKSEDECPFVPFVPFMSIRCRSASALFRLDVVTTSIAVEVV
jgi:hypothetical protein